MNWIAKVAAYKTLAVSPGGMKLYNLIRKRVTRTLVPSRPRVEHRLHIGLQYFNELEKKGDARRLVEGSHLDFGAGWHPAIPLLYYSLGCGRQFLFDVVPVLDAELLDATIRTFLEIVNDPAWPHRGLIRRLPERAPGRPLAAHLQSMGMTYYAPCAGRFPEIAGSIDVVTSTAVLCYIARPELKTSLEAIGASLRKGGHFLGKVAVDDEYAQSDRTISRYNHLRYSPWVWDNMVNSQMMSYNRLKARDYRALLENAGLQLGSFEVDGPDSADLEELRKIPIHPCFAHYSREELGAKHLTFIATNP